MKDMIIRGGEKIYASEIEYLLHKHPAIEEAHVFGVPDSQLGEIVAVWILLRRRSLPLSEKDVKEFCYGKISDSKIPERVHFTKEFPRGVRTTSGGIPKFVLRDMLEEATSSKATTAKTCTTTRRSIR